MGSFALCLFVRLWGFFYPVLIGSLVKSTWFFTPCHVTVTKFEKARQEEHGWLLEPDVPVLQRRFSGLKIIFGCSKIVVGYWQQAPIFWIRKKSPWLRLNLLFFSSNLTFINHFISAIKRRLNIKCIFHVFSWFFSYLTSQAEDLRPLPEPSRQTPDQGVKPLLEALCASIAHHGVGLVSLSSFSIYGGISDPWWWSTGGCGRS